MASTTQKSNKRYRKRPEVFFVYGDFTNEGVPFYWGKGDAQRVQALNRNKKHTNVATKYGFRREVVLITSIERLALDEEIRLIAETHTYVGDPEYNGIGCNFTKGGEGLGKIVSDETRRKMSEAKRGKKYSDEARRHMSEAKRNMSIETRQKLAERARNISDDTRKKISEGVKRARARKSEGWQSG